MRINRRRFLSRAAAASLVFSLPQIAAGRLRGANDAIRVGVAGLGGRGVGAHIPGFQSQEGVTVVAVSDPDHDRMESAAAGIKAKYGHDVQKFADMRDMFRVSDIDVIANATQNYWHGLSTIWACQNNKHVYVEKPLAHYVWEGRQMVNAARHHDRIVQVGTQHRSEQFIADLIGWLHEGHLGKILHVTAFANKRRVSCGRRDTPLPIPDNIDYDLWCGPAKKLPIYRDRLQYDCSFDWNTGDGESCNQGVHEVDVARWCLRERQLPRRVMSMGGRFLFNDACDTPNTQIIFYDFPSAPLLYEVHNLPDAPGSHAMPTFRGEHVGVVVACEGGTASMYQGKAWDNDGQLVKSFTGAEDHFVNFIRAVRSGRREDLSAEVEEGHLSTAVCHTGNIAYRVGHLASAKEQQDAASSIPCWNEMYGRFVQHLRAHQIDIDSVTLGPWLDIDLPNECFQNHAEANQIAHGFYRPSFAVPDLSEAAGHQGRPDA